MILLFRNGKFVIWKWIFLCFRKGKCEVDGPSRSIGANPSWKQDCCSPSCLWCVAQWDTSDRDNLVSKSGLLMDNIDTFICEVELRYCFFPIERKDCMNFRFALVVKDVGYKRGTVDTNLNCPLECWLLVSVGKPFPQRPGKCCRLETPASWWCLLPCTCHSKQVVSLQSRVLRDLNPKIYFIHLFYGKWIYISILAFFQIPDHV